MRSNDEAKQDYITALIERIHKLDTARLNYETSKTRKKNPSEIAEKEKILGNEEDDLKKELAKNGPHVKKAYEVLEKSAQFALETNKNEKARLLKQEIAKQQRQLELTAKADSREQITRPVKSASAPQNVNALSAEEVAHRQEVLAIQHFSGNEYYSLNYFPAMSELYDKIWKEISAGGESRYRDTANIRSDVCEHLNTIIGNNVPAKFTSSKETKHLHEKFIKAAMCIQQLGGTVKNEAYAELAEKELAKKKISPEAFYKGKLTAEQFAPVKQSHSYPQYKK